MLEVELSNQFGLIIISILQFLYGGLFLPYTFIVQRCHDQNKKQIFSEEEQQKNKVLKDREKEQKRSVKFVTFYIDLVIKTIYLIFLGYTIYSGILASTWFEEIVTQKCMGTDVSFYPDFEKYKKFHKLIQLYLFYIAVPILAILVCDTIYLSIRQDVKDNKVLRIRRKKSRKTNSRADILK